MKKLFLTIAIAAALIACNSDKEPPDDGYTKAVAARNDSLAVLTFVRHAHSIDSLKAIVAKK